jgi:hypothetical protein
MANMECQARSNVPDLSADPAEIGIPGKIRATTDPAVTRKSLKDRENISRQRNCFHVPVTP